MNPEEISVGILYNAPEDAGNGVLDRSAEAAAQQAADALASCGFKLAKFPLRRNVPGWIDRIRKSKPHVLVNLCESFQGQSAREASIAGVLELLGIPFTGNPSRVLGLCQDKFQTKAVMNVFGLPTPGGWIVENSGEISGVMRFPVIVKPNAEDASVGISPESVVSDVSALRDRVDFVANTYRQPALIEEYIEGREFNVAVIEDPSPRALPVSEIEFRDYQEGEPKILGYAAKWEKNHVLYGRTVPSCPAKTSEALTEKLQSLALQAFRVMNLKGYARLDFRADSREQVFILEVNPNPDTSLDAGLARGLAAAGLAYPEFWRGQVLGAMNGSAKKA
ncbi:MAG: ATP-grasp domain-containing protein [Lentisphaerae bacterium]|nr:ATP-grasp domain-containing protein [Lentisphaerota bacterium]